MKRLRFNKVLDCLSMSLVSPISCNSCMSHINEEEDKDQRKSLLKSHWDQMLELRDVFGGAKALALHLEAQTVELRVSMHCHGCARKVEKHISKMEGVTSFQVDLQNKKVVVTGDITPGEVLESISKVMKFAELLEAPKPSINEVPAANYHLISL
ncbi:Heavy metal-associated isoprenylated plant protein 32 [Rhynchospora pubera]|uniref:Heavy metal-associated isoprenylated plant protein 32 n=1 Tax=Rhynchospora pubera TaxID=906938 RepID=A0AAV8DQ46_9POAL|nr:Heavy metal-associated isoprenylated plant protein 32 [Rhynchospora pubera]KAJ4768386.1 Heavy metal-associated isoprenylated plant protein 32 [Rhynchospora pubera]KAJ4797302.1 Heavy metal-associated isoprenylated plant protein 32 [Rhynchospora pubera]KAJ4821092.1 Heavy metal-associated isoprenylated plant protein 32 [Rhynchospora pubera]